MNGHNSFLYAVARFCSDGQLGCPPSDIAFVLPNKRAAMFLKKYMRECTTGVTMMPRFMTLRTFLAIFAKYPEVNPLQQLFVLYDAYRSVLAKRGRIASAREFDNFIFWGDMMLADFDEIDKSLVDADKLFKNLKDVKEIQADYLDDEQKDVIRRVWGDSRLTTDISEFWMHLADDAPEDSVSAKFIYLWEIMADIYREFNERLEKKGISSAGRQFRTAVEAARHHTDFDLNTNTIYAFVGFNDLSVAESLVFERLKKAGAAAFFWDTAPLRLCLSDKMPAALERLKNLVRHFPSPADFVVPVPDYYPDITVTSVPSNVGQAKAIAGILEDWGKKDCYDKANPINTAIVLPDQGLLLPALLSLPDDIQSVNISMGLPFRTTTFATLLHSIVSMHLRVRKLHGISHFYYEDVIEVLQHPHLRAVAAEAADRIAKYITDGKVYNLAATDITHIAPELEAIFVPINEPDNVKSVGRYLDTLLNWLGTELEKFERGPQSVPGFEISAIDYFKKELEKLVDLTDRHGIKMAERTFLHLFERILATRTLTLSGKPLQGLQILGVLETRALDFDNVIILSMNDGVFPRRQYAKTMIPNILRKGYGLPDFESLEWTYAYCFYRLIARARNVALFYDARAEGKGKGERSRYISQIKYLMPLINIKEQQLTVGASPSAPRSFSVPKTPEVMNELNRFRPGGQRKLSASSIKQYLKCPFSFYLKYVRGMSGSDEMVNYLTGADYGNIVHATIQNLFEPYENELITAAHFDRWLADNNREIEKFIIGELLKVRRNSGGKDENDLDAEGRIAMEAIATIVRADLRAEKEKYAGIPFTFIKNEYKVNTLNIQKPWIIDDKLSINFEMSVDRVDATDAHSLRFIDFKTGAEDTSVQTTDGLFNRTSTAKHGMFQLLTYCEAYLSLVDDAADITPVLHPMQIISQGLPIPDLKCNRIPILSYRKNVRDSFRPLFNALINEIFNKDIPFAQCETDNNCTFCNFASLCGRQKVEN